MTGSIPEFIAHRAAQTPPMMLAGTSDMAMTLRAADAIFAVVMFDHALVGGGA